MFFDKQALAALTEALDACGVAVLEGPVARIGVFPGSCDAGAESFKYPGLLKQPLLFSFYGAGWEIRACIACNGQP